MTGRAGERETTASDRALRDFLDTFADHEEQWAGGSRREVATRLADLARPEVGESCLDIGGGAGMAAALSEAVGPTGSVVSIDVSDRTMRLTTSGTNTHLMKMSGEDVIFRDHAFDVVVLSRSIAYEAHVYAVLGEASRILKVGGRLALFCRRRGLGTAAERLFLTELATLVRELAMNVPEQFFGYAGLADRRELELVLRRAGLDRISFGDVVTGGRSADVGGWNREMMGCWPAARIILEALVGEKRLLFERHVEQAMKGLGDDAYRFHHAYLLAAGTKARD